MLKCLRNLILFEKEKSPAGTGQGELMHSDKNYPEAYIRISLKAVEILKKHADGRGIIGRKYARQLFAIRFTLDKEVFKLFVKDLEDLGLIERAGTYGLKILEDHASKSRDQPSNGMSHEKSINTPISSPRSLKGEEHGI